MEEKNKWLGTIMGFSHHYTFMQERVSEILLEEGHPVKTESSLGKHVSLWSAPQGKRRCKEQTSLKARHYFNQRYLCLAAPNVCPLPN